MINEEEYDMSKIDQILESMQRYAGIWKDTKGQWWLDIAMNEYEEYEDAFTIGPFSSEERAIEYLADNYSNPGGYSIDDRGKVKPPKKSPNGSKIREPQIRPRY